jgi:2-methylisocitrate lyase-like PEP mutase family enzyme
LCPNRASTAAPPNRGYEYESSNGTDLFDGERPSIVTIERQAWLAHAFRGLHSNTSGRIIALPNAFDVATARLIARQNPAAIGTSSGAMAAILGYPDGEYLDRDEMLTSIARIARAVTVGVNADVEAGYGDDPNDAAWIAQRLVEIGVIGLNIQDTGNPRGHWAGRLLPINLAVSKIEAIRSTADGARVPLVINARTDTFLEAGDPVAAAIDRGNRYLAAGADCVFVPGVVNEADIARLIAGLHGPLNVYAVPGTPPVARLEEIGVKRVSIGCGPYQACLALAEDATREFLESGSYGAFASHQMGYADMLGLVSEPEHSNVLNRR